MIRKKEKFSYFPLMTSLRKVNVKLTYEFSKAVSRKEINPLTKIGFVDDMLHYNKLILRMWYLSPRLRHLWRHHYIGAQGVIILIPETLDEKMIWEILNVISDKNLYDIPFLFVLNKERITNEFLMTVEKLRLELSRTEMKFVYNLIYVRGIDEICYGLDWLCSNMKPLT